MGIAHLRMTPERQAARGGQALQGRGLGGGVRESRETPAASRSGTLVARYFAAQKTIGPRAVNVPGLVGVAGNPGVA